MAGDGDGVGGCVWCHARRVLKVLLGALILVCFVSVLSIGNVSPNAVIKASAEGVSITPHDAHFKHGRKMLVSNRRVDLGHHFIVVSKRRVPNGPDPIHNRRVGESRRPPGRA